MNRSISLLGAAYESDEEEEVNEGETTTAELSEDDPQPQLPPLTKEPSRHDPPLLLLPLWSDMGMMITVMGKETHRKISGNQFPKFISNRHPLRFFPLPPSFDILLFSENRLTSRRCFRTVNTPSRSKG